MAFVASESGCFPYPRPEENSEADSSEENGRRCADILACGQGSGGAGGQPLPPPGCVPSDGADWNASETCGVFVSVKGKDSNPGTPSEPVKTIGKAVELALSEAQTRRVYACAGDDQTFIEQVVVPDSVTIFGGLDCASSWKRSETKTKLTAGEGEIPLRMAGTSGTVRLEDLHVVAASTEAQVPDGERKGDGLSSIAATADGMTVQLARCVLEAGDAAQGANGAPYDDSPGNELAAPKGADGLPGADACSETSDAGGGAEVTSDCGTPEDPVDDSSGGKGGSGRLMSGGDGEQGLPTTPLNDEPNGGTRETTAGANCTAGRPGGIDNNDMPVTAEAGGPGENSSVSGAISSDGYTGIPGVEGKRGAPGRGGGGGGGARGVPANVSSRSCPGVSGEERAGASGGSGGAGGCGGKGGRGGRPGGSSIALVSINASLSFDEVTLIAGKGGDGGEGGFGQDGGPGGMGGPGGVVPQGSTGLDPACAGGRGGTGGTGGRGAGGQGGHSLGIAFRGTDLPVDGDIEGATITPGRRGLVGGLEGDPAEGKSEKVLRFQ
ncbi:hypothetical protein [Sorangium sp. So ce233]|uniref:hypothetical protein n=1 Tax=Sorangium sp. So ce233 TaxID=3133290 RepID=UPI003F6227B3